MAFSYLIQSLAVFALAALGGYFLLPFFLAREKLHFYISHSTNLEAAWRDRALKFLTDRMGFISPNAVTIIGFLLVGVLSFLFLKEASFQAIFWFTLAAGFTDMLDGSLARNNRQVTKIGAVLDWSRDLLLAVVVGFFIVRLGLLPLWLFLWFFVGWFFLGLVRFFELKVSSGKIFSPDEDFKFALDRVRLALAWYGVLILLSVPYNAALGRAAEALIIISIAFSWLSLLFHSAHLRFLKEEKTGP